VITNPEVKGKKVLLNNPQPAVRRSGNRGYSRGQGTDLRSHWQLWEVAADQVHLHSPRHLGAWIIPPLEHGLLQV